VRSRGPLRSRRCATGCAALPPTGAGREPRPSRPARGVPQAVHAGSLMGSLMEACWFLLVPVPKRLGGTSPAKLDLKQWPLRGTRDRSPLIPRRGNLSPPSRSPSHQRGGSGGWPRRSMTKTPRASRASDVQPSTWNRQDPRRHPLHEAIPLGKGRDRRAGHKLLAHRPGCEVSIDAMIRSRTSPGTWPRKGLLLQGRSRRERDRRIEVRRCRW
jgi:hypothetical protein